MVNVELRNSTVKALSQFFDKNDKRDIDAKISEALEMLKLRSKRWMLKNED